MIDQIIWGIAFVVMLIAELATLQLVSIWFAVGALIAFIASFFGVPFGIQLIIFAVVSAVLLLLTRPFIKKFSAKIVPTNADLDIGKTATVIEEIDSERGTGRALLNGVGWIAISEDKEIIPKDSVVQVQKISGAKLTVTKIK